MLSYNNGFQVWDLQHPDGKREVLSVRDPTPIKSVKVGTSFVSAFLMIYPVFAKSSWKGTPKFSIGE